MAAGAARRGRLAAVTDRPLRVVLYRRVSALMGRGGDDFHSPELQTAAMRRHIGPLGLREVAVVEDIDKTGRNFERAGLDEIRAMVESGQVDVVAVYDLSRLGRNVGEALHFIRWLKERRVSLISTVEKIDDTPEGQFFLTQFLAMAQLYSDQIGRRWSEVIEQRARRGQHHSTPPLGYRRDPETKHLVVDPVVGPAVTAAFRAYAAGSTVAQIVRDLRDARGKPTHFPTVKVMLNNPTYLGKVVLWGIGRHRMPTWRDVPKFLGDGTHPPLVDAETFEACRRRQQQDSKTVTRHLAISHPLVGVARCGLCGRHMQLHTSNRPNQYDILLCGMKQSAQACDGPGTPRLDYVVDAVLDDLAQRIQQLRGDVGAHAQALAKAARAGADSETAQRELAATRESMDKLTQGWLAGRVPDSAYEANVARLTAAEATLVDRLEQTRGSADVPPPPEVANMAEELLRLWPELSIAERNAAVKRLVREVRVFRRAPGKRRPVIDQLEIVYW